MALFDPSAPSAFVFESLKAPFTTRITGPPFMRFGGLVLQALAVAASVVTAAMAAGLLVPLFMLDGGRGPLERVFLVVMALMFVMTLVLGAVAVSMLGTTLRFWQARDRRGRTYAITLGILAFLVAAAQVAAWVQGAPSRATTGALAVVWSGVAAALLGIGLHPAGKHGMNHKTRGSPTGPVP